MRNRAAEPRVPNPVRRDLKRRIDAAMGREPCDLVLKRARYLDVFSLEWVTGDLAIVDGVIVGVEGGLKAKRVIDLGGKAVVPGFVDAHVHIESSLMTPDHFARAVLPRGTTTAICDPHELANVVGVGGINYFLDAADVLPLRLKVMLSSCVPATDFETNGAGEIHVGQLLPLLAREHAIGLAEMMNVPGVLNADPAVLAKLEGFAERSIDGHSPLLSGQELSAYACTGISTCHEVSRVDEAREKIRKGMSVWIREGSVAKNLKTLAPVLTVANSVAMGFCTDDRNPLDIAEEGHLDHLIRGAIAEGVAPEVAYRAASLTPARHYRLGRVGAVAPGYDADLVVLGDVRTCEVEQVIRAGVPVDEIRFPATRAADTGNTIRAHAPTPRELTGPSGRVHVIGVESGSLITGHDVTAHDASGVARLSVLERYGKRTPPANGYVRGFGEKLRGAIASSVGHDSHNLIVVGARPEEMSVALGALIECGGGFCVVGGGGKVLAKLALPMGGLMTARDPEEVRKALVELRQASRSIGCELAEPFLQLAFLSLPVIPRLKLTDRGLVDVDKFQMISVSA